MLLTIIALQKNDFFNKKEGFYQFENHDFVVYTIILALHRLANHDSNINSNFASEKI